ncbi:transposase (plasmid) [Azospirillum sp. B510]|nr:transposase [Azospirillum sp. B510]
MRGGELCRLCRLRRGSRGAVSVVFASGERGAEPRHLLAHLPAVGPVAFAACFGRFLEGLGTAGAGVIAIDGKTLRRSFDDAARSNPLAVVTAFASATRLVVGQHSYRVAEGDSEILAARALLECLDLQGHLVTADAIHCQEETARLIRERGGDYLLR